MSRALRVEALWLSLGLGGGGILGELAGYLGVGLLSGLLPVLGRHLYQLLRLCRRLAAHRRFGPPFPSGLWGEIEAAFAQEQQRLRRHKRRQLRFAERFRGAALSVPDALVVLDKNLCLEWANPAADHLLGARWPEHQGQPLTEAVPHGELGDYLAAGDYGQPLELLPEHNRALRLSLRITPFGAKKRQWLLVARDITKLYHLEEMRRDFLANASHELRTPLTVIGGFLETLQHSPDTPGTLRHPVALMVEQAGRMGDIINELLALSRLQLGERPEHLEPVDMSALLGEAVRAVTAADNGQRRLELDLNPELLLLGNEGELQGACANLIRNALQHTAAGEGIRVTWQDTPEGPTLRVQDSGQGIAPEHIPRLTEYFYRVDEGRSRDSGGPGLGLALVELVLSRHQGQLMITSVVGGGSTFTCRFAPTAALRRSGGDAAALAPAARPEHQPRAARQSSSG